MKLDAPHFAMSVMQLALLRAEVDPTRPTEYTREALDTLLNACPQGECCDQCAAIFCPFMESLHFHHDGCPCCATIPEEKWQSREWKDEERARLMTNNTQHQKEST